LNLKNLRTRVSFLDCSHTERLSLDPDELFKGWEMKRIHQDTPTRRPMRHVRQIRIDKTELQWAPMGHNRATFQRARSRRWDSNDGEIFQIELGTRSGESDGVWYWLGVTFVSAASDSWEWFSIQRGSNSIFLGYSSQRAIGLILRDERTKRRVHKEPSITD
jgi:hypothetical protein